LGKHLAVDYTSGGIGALGEECLGRHDWHLLDKDVQNAGGVDEFAFNEARLMIINKAGNTNGDG